jgi:hypothetical protein
MRKSNYDKFPVIPVPSAHAMDCWSGWEAIDRKLKQEISGLLSKNCRSPILAIECYTGVYDDEIRSHLAAVLKPALVIDSKEAFYSPSEIDFLVAPSLGGDDPIFGFFSELGIEDFIDPASVKSFQAQIGKSQEGLILIVGPGASCLAPQAHLFVYADMPRWEGQCRQRQDKVSNLGVVNRDIKASLQYKRSFFIDWRVCDRLKKDTMDRWNFLLDTTSHGKPRMITGLAHLATLACAAHRPFRVVPFFDPGPWGGQWMKEMCDLDRSQTNYAWCFDCVPEENSLLIAFAEDMVEIPAINLVCSQPRALLGDDVYERFGAEFPIRFDFLDTMGGGNLSFQVHPIREYALSQFGLHYTQDESYYLLDVGTKANVFLGRRNDADLGAMMYALEEAAAGKSVFPTDTFAASWPARKHDHFLIPAGTLHCSGAECMVLEVSATPYIFTFKLWDWGRMGLDHKPRPINLSRGREVIDWSWNETRVRRELINTIQPISLGEGWREERTGLHRSQFIETRRHWFARSVSHHTRGNLNVLNLVEGDEIIVESPDKAFEPFVVHYVETFIIPAAMGPYTIRPVKNERHATLKAFVRPNYK